MKDKESTVSLLKVLLKEWVDRESKPGSAYSSWIRSFREELDVQSRESALNAALHAQSVAEFEVTAGADMVLDGQPLGWNRISNAVDYYYWFLRVDRADLGTGKQAYRAYNYSFPLFMHMFCLAVALEKYAMAHWFAEELQRFYKYGLAEKGTGDIPYREFIRVFSASYLTNRWPSENELTPALGVYRQLFIQNGKEAITAACDYHLQNACPDGRENLRNMAFTWFSFTLLPVELLAYLKYRKSMGLPLAEMTSHPLMNTPLAQPPENLNFTKDSLLEILENRAKKHFKIKNSKTGLFGLFNR